MPPASTKDSMDDIANDRSDFISRMDIQRQNIGWPEIIKGIDWRPNWHQQ
jgi:hypothetical protein